MFQLVVIEDKIICTPDQINRDPSEVLIEQIEIKYVNKVIPNVGLGIAFFDFSSVGEPYIYPAAGSAIRLVIFRLVVFKPFVGEVITGRITHISKEGMKVSIEFFDDITISGSQLQNPSEYNPAKNQWTWTYDDGENQTPFVTELGDEIRFKVRSVSFTSVSQTLKGVTATTTSESSAMDASNAALVRRRSSSVDVASEQEAPAAMQIAGSTNDFGLGVTSWW